MLTVVTAIFGPAFVLHEPTSSWPGVRFVCFTDQPLQSDRWEVVPETLSLSRRRCNRFVKTLLHRYIQGPTLYIDSEFQITADPHEFLGAALESNCWAATRHPQRDCLFAEAGACLAKGRVEEPYALIGQLQRYRGEGMPEHFGLWTGNVLARRGDEDSARLGEAWWSEIEKGSERDQVSLPFVARKLGLMPFELPGVYTELPGIVRRKLNRRYVEVRG